MWQFWNGYVIIQLEGYSAARFLRRMTDAGIRAYDVHRVETGRLQLTIPARRFRSLHRLRRGLRLRVRIVKRGGLPFAIRRLWRRPVLWAGSLLLFLATMILSTRIWVIRIERTERVDPAIVASLLEERGIRPGASLSGPILITASEDLTAQVPGAAYVSLERDGVMLKVHIKEALSESPKKTDRVPYDVVAEKDGVVLSVNVMRGQARVGVGDSVKAGDVLISGTVLYQDKSFETSADGTVTAAVQYRAEAALEDRITESVETDRAETVKTLCFAQWTILESKPSFAHWRLTDSHVVSVTPLLPIRIEKRTAKEIVFRERTLSQEEAEELALTCAREAAFAQVPRDAAIINIYGTIRVRDGKPYAEAIVTAEETIGRTEENPHDG